MNYVSSSYFNSLSSAMDRARVIYSALYKHWHGPEKGIHRPGYSAEESEAIDVIAAHAHSLGMEDYEDLAGNRFFLLPGEDRSRPVFLSGSHIDSVSRGGRYDGSAGVVTALCAAAMVKESGRKLAHDFGVAVWRCEESPWFGQFAVGSNLAAAKLGEDFLQKKRSDSGDTLYTHMNALGLRPDILQYHLSSKKTIFPAQGVGMYVEAHIEQGQILDKAQKSLGIVTGIRGNIRYPGYIQFCGRAGHTGTVPQEERQDAVRAGAAFITHSAKKFDRIMAAGRDIVYSYPGFYDHANPATTIPAMASVRVEVRSLDECALSLAREAVARAAQDACMTNGCDWDKTHASLKPLYTAPTPMDRKVRELLGNGAENLGVTAISLASGAGHDAAIVAQMGVPSGIVFMRHGNGGLSHDPNEILGFLEGDDPFRLDGSFAHAAQLIDEIGTQSVSKQTKEETSFAKALLSCGGRKLSHHR